MEQRIEYFDQLKGIAIILVVIGHVMQFSFGFDSSDVVDMLGIFHMPVFFYISGYFLYKQIDKISLLFVKLYRRTLSLLVPYLVFGALWCMLSGYSFRTLILEGDGRYWFLYVLFLLSSFFILYGYFLQRIKRGWVYICLWILPYLAIIIVKVYENNVGGVADVLCVNQLNTYYRYFLIGYLCRRYSKLNSFLFKNDIVYALGLLSYFLQWRLCDTHNMALIFLGGIGAIIVLQRYVEMVQTSDNWVLSALSKIGCMSLSIYVIHYFFIPEISGVIHDLAYAGGGNIFLWQLLLSALLALPIVGASMFVGKLIETNKYLNIVFFGRLFK